MPTTAVHRREGKGRGRERGRMEGGRGREGGWREGGRGKEGGRKGGWRKEREGGKEGSNYLHVMPRLWDSW